MTKYTVSLQWHSDGPPQQATFDLQRPITIGRQPDNDIVLKDGKVSRTHALVFSKDNHLCLINLSQTNSIYVTQGGQRQALDYNQEVILEENTTFQISSIIFQAVDYSGATSPSYTELDAKIICPKCGRGVPARLRECPYDGTSLENGRLYFEK